MTLLYHHNEIGLGLVKLNGPLLRHQADEVTNTFRTLFRQGPQRVVVDLADVPFLDSLGLGALVAGYRLFGSEPQNFRVVGLQDQPQLVLELTGFDHVLQNFETVVEAMTEKPVALPLPDFVPLAQSSVSLF